MPAIITDQFRILNAETFVKSFTGIGTTTNYYYTFLAHPNPTNTTIENYGISSWNSNPPEPRDSFQQENLYFDSMLFLKKVNYDDISRVIPRYDWESGIIYDMYRNNYDISNPAPQTDSKTLYDSRYYVVNSSYKVYICLNNGENPEYPKGQKSVNEPNFVDSNPQQAGDGTDGYLWKYLYTITPKEIIKFSTSNYIPVPKNWSDSETESIKNTAINGKIETIIIKNRGSGYAIPGGETTGTISNIPIIGDGSGGFASVTINGGEIDTVQVTNGGTDYTRAFIKFGYGYSETPDITSGSGGVFEVIIPPKGGHGYDIYRELGSYRVMVYSKYESESDYVIGNDFSRVGIIKNPTIYGSQNQPINSFTATNLGALKLKPVGSGNISDTFYPNNSLITQNIGVGSTAIGYVASWNQNTGILRYYQPVGLSTLFGGKNLFNFVGYASTINCSNITGSALIVDTNFSGDVIQIGGKNINLGQSFTSGISNPEIKKYFGEIIYIDNRAPITRSSSQKEEVKIVVEF
jgi:hypothetical protein